MKLENSIYIDAPLDLLWAVTEDVEQWPEWTPTVSAITPLSGSPFGLGSRVRIKQPAQPATVWSVTGFLPNECFSWESSILGMRMIASHELTAAKDGTINVLRIKISGLVAMIQWPLLYLLIRWTLSQENAGLKSRCEAMVKSQAAA